jgi:Glycosyl hydrolase family 47
LSGSDGIEATNLDARRNATSQKDVRSDPNLLFPPLTAAENSADSFLYAWKKAHAAIKRHMYKEHIHPHYINVHLNTGSPQALWVDSLGAYYPGLLTLAGETEEAITSHLLYTALWTRYSALPERWSTRDYRVEGGLGWWPGRPEFIESTYHLYRATKDPFYLRVGEMVLRDIQRRCRTKCGWAGIQDVRSGELTDRMESFFLGETAKYLFLLFNPTHPLNSLDAPYVFTTEGHPLMIPRALRTAPGDLIYAGSNYETCPVSPKSIPFTISAVTAREDFFHAAGLAKLHLIPTINTLDSVSIEFNSDHPSIVTTEPISPTNYTFFPWTLPSYLVPSNGTSSSMTSKDTFEIQFPMRDGSLQNVVLGGGAMQRVAEGIMITSMDGIKLGLIRDEPRQPYGEEEDYRLHRVGNIQLGRDERVFISKGLIGNMDDPNFMIVRDEKVLELVIDTPTEASLNTVKAPESEPSAVGGSGHYGGNTNKSPNPLEELVFSIAPDVALSDVKDKLNAILEQFTSNFLGEVKPQPEVVQSSALLEHRSYSVVNAITPTGIGAGPLPEVAELPALDVHDSGPTPLVWTRIYVGGNACNYGELKSIARDYQVLVIMRGGCSFSEKLSNLPSFVATKNSLRLVVVVSYPEHEVNDGPSRYDGNDRTPFIRPMLDKIQVTRSGIVRRHPVAMVLVGGGQATYDALKKAQGMSMKRKYHVEVQGTLVKNLVVL